MAQHINITNINGDPNVGLYARATDKFCLVARTLNKSIIEELSTLLKVPIVPISLYGTEFAGIFCAANSTNVLIPDIIYEDEKEKLKAQLKKIGVKLHVLKTVSTALGNNILLNDKAGIIGSVYDTKEIAQIKKAFPEVKFIQNDLCDTTIPGSIGYITNKGGLFSHNLSEKEVAAVEKLLGFEIGLGTVNLGNPFVASAIIANSFGLIVGASSSGFEIARIDESLGFLKA